MASAARRLGVALAARRLGVALAARPQQTSPMALTDVHGAGAQRSSPKAGDESRLPKGAGPQGDVLRINNFARCVRG